MLGEEAEEQALESVVHRLLRFVSSFGNGVKTQEPQDAFWRLLHACRYRSG